MYKKSVQGWLKHWDFMLLDIIMLQVCFVLTFFIINKFHPVVRNPYKLVNYRYLATLMLLSQSLVMLFTNSYKNIVRRGPFEELLAVFKYTLLIVLCTIFILFIFQQSKLISRLQLGVTSAMFVGVSFIVRTLNKKFIRWLHDSDRNENKHSLVLMTSSDLLDEAIVGLTASKYVLDYFVSGIVLLDDRDPSREYYNDIPIVGYNDDVLVPITRGWVDEVFILQPDNMNYPMKLMDSLLNMGITVHYSMAALNNDDWGTPQVHKLGHFKVLTNSLHFVSVGEVMLKRLIDIIGGIVGCLFTLLIALFIGPIIKRQSPGPLFFKQERVGRNGKVFKMYKFRSMYMDAEQRKADLMKNNIYSDGMMFKMDDDPRIIGSEKKDKRGRPKGIGNFIRNTSLDEFPQFFNVLKGDMSIVGTRPPTLDEWNKYEVHHRLRMSIKPGITGMWQISGRNEIDDFEEVVKLDAEYIDNWNLALDVKIILKTIGVVLLHRGAK